MSREGGFFFILVPSTITICSFLLNMLGSVSSVMNQEIQNLFIKLYLFKILFGCIFIEETSISK